MATTLEDLESALEGLNQAKMDLFNATDQKGDVRKENSVINLGKTKKAVEKGQEVLESILEIMKGIPISAFFSGLGDAVRK